MGKVKTPKKISAVVTPVKSELKTPKQAKNTPVKAALLNLKMEKKVLSKQAMSSPKAAAMQTPKMKNEALVGLEPKNTPKAAAIQTPKSQVKKEALKEKAKSTPEAAPKTLQNGTPFVKKGKKEALQKKTKSTSEAAPKTLQNGTPLVKKPKKTKVPKQKKPVEDVEMASEGVEEAATSESPVKAKPFAKKTASVKSASSKEGGEFVLFVKNLHYESEQDRVFKHFQQFGTVKRCFMPRNPTKSNLIKGFGFVEYNSQEDMDKALAAVHTLDSKILLVTRSTVEKPVGVKRKRDESVQPVKIKKQQLTKFDNEVFVAKLPLSTTTNSIQEHFSQFGEVINIGLPMKSPTLNKGYAFVAFKEESSVKKAMEKSDQQIDEADIVVAAGNEKKPTAKDPLMKPILSFPNELFVGGLDSSTVKPTLEQHFSKYGKVVNVTLPWNKEDHRNKGFGFVAFESAASLKKAQGEDHAIDGRLIGLRVGEKTKENGTSSQKTKSEELKASPALENMEDDSEEDEEDGDEEEEVEGEEVDSEDEEVEGESDEAEDEADEEGEEEEDDDAVENEDEEDENDEDDEDGDKGGNDEDDDDDDDDDDDE